MTTLYGDITYGTFVYGFDSDSPFAVELYEAMAPHAYADQENDWALWSLCVAVARQFDLVDELVRGQEDREAWTVALDVDRTPAIMLPWLALLVGDRLPAGLGEQASRDRIKDVRGFRRGTPATIAAAAADTLTDTKTVWFFERAGGEAYQLRAATLQSETPDEAATERAVHSQKPAGIVLTYDAVPGGDYATLLAAHSDYADVEASFASYFDLRNDPSL